MKDLYLKAAKNVFYGISEYSCWAIHQAENGFRDYEIFDEIEEDYHIEIYTALFSPIEDGQIIWWDDRDYGITGQRTLALLLMQEIYNELA